VRDENQTHNQSHGRASRADRLHLRAQLQDLGQERSSVARNFQFMLSSVALRLGVEMGTEAFYATLPKKDKAAKAVEPRSETGKAS